MKQCQHEMKNEVTRQLQDQGNRIDQQWMHLEVLNNKIDNGLVNVKKEIDILKLSLRGDALEILQTLNEDQHKNYEDLVLQLEMRFGEKHLQQVYQAQLKGRNQRMNESLQQYEADIARLVYLAYPTASRDFIEQLAVQDCETQQALRLARCKKLNEVLAHALEFEADKQASRGHSRIRQIRTRTPEREYRSSNMYNRSYFKDDVENLRQNIKDIQASLENMVEQADQKKPDHKF
ncbi:hypothetical protein NQ317_000266 [Molorchus minor]|uniref:Uncharacterized protein n=1 Tax=Molorchus minor TaxID=1323400 RepID=A0ABQ9JRP8_9CUCU|nr:hypothetical protein NQ317_000266 [Molorchus minor]